MDVKRESLRYSAYSYRKKGKNAFQNRLFVANVKAGGYNKGGKKRKFSKGDHSC